jgi:DNA-binding MarR family transcriptional regulator
MRNPSRRSSRNLEAQLQGRPPEEAIPWLLKSLHHTLRHVVEDALRRERVDISFAHVVTLFAVQSEPGLSGGELARRGFVTAQTMNTILRRLERDRQIERRPHPSSARADSWHVTRAGEAQLARAKGVGTGIWRNMLSALAPREVTQLQSLLQRCIAKVDEQVTEGETPPRKRRAPRPSARRRRARSSAPRRRASAIAS